jgi:hypothetical protein
METDVNVRRLVSERRRSDIQKWLSPPDPSTNYNKALQLRHENSGQWFLESTAYLRWKAEPGSFLWLRGKAGCGKTILSSSIIEDQKRAISSSGIMLYFYFDFSDTGKQTLEYALRSLVYQLYCGLPGAQCPLDLLFSACSDGRSQPSVDSLTGTFQRMLDLSEEVGIILDALDECPTRNQGDRLCLLSWIKTLYDRVLTTSRPEQDIEYSLHWAGSERSIDLESSLVHEDVCSFICDRVYRHPSLGRWRGHPDIQEEIEQALVSKADGMYESQLHISFSLAFSPYPLHFSFLFSLRSDVFY